MSKSKPDRDFFLKKVSLFNYPFNIHTAFSNEMVSLRHESAVLETRTIILFEHLFILSVT